MSDEHISTEDDTPEGDGSQVDGQDEAGSDKEALTSFVFALDKERREKMHKIMKHHDLFTVGEVVNKLIDEEWDGISRLINYG